jgi:hypothetical protein
MSHVWTLEERHGLHVLATHFPQSYWVDRGAIFNHVFGLQLSHEKIRDEYGGHKNGRRNAPTGPPTRSVMWNDHVCRDEFNLLPYSQQQVQTRRNLLQRIQASITQLGLRNNNGLGAINILDNRVRADTNVLFRAAATAAVANPVPAPASNTTAPAAATASSSSAAAGTTSTDPAQGGRPWYHTQEITKEGDRFVYRPVDNLSYSVTPTNTYRRTVEFSSTLTVTVQVCDLAVCSVCRHGRPTATQ